MDKTDGALKGRPIDTGILCRPFGARHLYCPNPGLTPGAIQFRPFGPQTCERAPGQKLG